MVKASLMCLRIKQKWLNLASDFLFVKVLKSWNIKKRTKFVFALIKYPTEKGCGS